MKLYLIRFNGYYLSGEMLIIDETKRKAFNQVKIKLEDMKLLDKNKDLCVNDLEEIDINAKYLIVIDDGDY